MSIVVNLKLCTFLLCSLLNTYLVNFNFHDYKILIYNLSVMINVLVSLLIRIMQAILLGDSYNRGEKIDSSKFGADPGVLTGVSSEISPSSNRENKRTTAYRCKKCRRVVALQENVVDHIPGEGETSFAWNKRRSGNPFNKSDEPECSSIFVEPLRWMSAGIQTCF